MSTESKAKFSVGVSVLVVRDNKLLLGRRINTGTLDGWLSTPGGRIEETEDMYAAARRELKEETGLDSDALLVIGFKEHFRSGEHYFMFYLFASDVQGVPENKEPGKCEGWCWVEWDKVPLDECTEPLEILNMTQFLSTKK